MLLSWLIFLSLTAEMPNDFSPAVGFYNGDALRSSILWGGSYTYHFSDEIWLGGELFGGELNVDEPNGVSLQTGQRMLAADGVISWNIPSLLGASFKDKNRGYAADLYTALGVGNFWLGNRREIYGLVGGGLLFHFPYEHFGLKFDLKGIFFNLKNSQGEDFNFDSILSLGPSFLF